jgi:hypothetical protein
VTKIMGSSSDDWIYEHFGYTLSLLITINAALSLIWKIYSSPMHTHWDSHLSLVVSWQRISTQKLALQITMESSCYFFYNHSENSEIKILLDSLLQLTTDS